MLDQIYYLRLLFVYFQEGLEDIVFIEVIKNVLVRVICIFKKFSGS